MTSNMASTSSLERTAEEGPVQISVVNGDAFVWSPRWIAKLRREFGVVGMLVGSLPLIPQQNVFLGVPLQLFEEEVVYLLRSKAAVLVDDVAAHARMQETMTPDEVRQWHDQRRLAIEENKRRSIEASQQSRKQWEKSAHLQKEKVEEKRRERERKRQERQQANADGEESVFAERSEPQTAAETPTDPHPAETANLQGVSHLVTIATSSLELPWHCVEIGVNAFDRLSSAARAGVWQYPKTSLQRARCAVFEDLRTRRNYYMGKGIRFGGDFVVYPGDPLRYHSHFTATVQESPSTAVSAQELVAAGRLGTAVKKAHLLCAVSPPSWRNKDGGKQPQQEGEDELWQATLGGEYDLIEREWGLVDYYSLTWAGFGT